MEKLIVNTVKRAMISDVSQAITKACDKIRSRVIGPRTNKPHSRRSPKETHTKWTKQAVSQETWRHEVLRQDTLSQRQPRFKREIHKVTEDGWEKRWTAYLNSIPHDRVKPPVLLATVRETEQLYDNASKSTCSLITQIRTEKIGLNAFLTDRRVPGYTAQCQCGWRRQTAKHILYFCPNHATDRESLFINAGTRDYSQMLATSRGAKAAARWLQSLNLLPQFHKGLDVDSNPHEFHSPLRNDENPVTTSRNR